MSYIPCLLPMLRTFLFLQANQPVAKQQRLTQYSCCQAMTVLRRLYQFLHSEFNLTIFHGIMFFFFFEMIGELNSSSSLLSFVYSPASTSSYPGYITLLFVPILGPILPAILGLFRRYVRFVIFCLCILERKQNWPNYHGNDFCMHCHWSTYCCCVCTKPRTWFCHMCQRYRFSCLFSICLAARWSRCEQEQ